MTNQYLSFAHRVAHDTYAIDTGFGRDGFDASYLLVADGNAAFIDTGTQYSIPRLLKTLDELEVPLANVSYVILTHVHLDHAGGAGLLILLEFFQGFVVSC